MNPVQVKPLEYYLVFTYASYDHWIWNIVDRGMGHVYAIQDINEYQWLIIQPRNNYTEVKLMSKLEYPVINTLVDKDDKMLKVNALPTCKHRGALNWFTCVEQVKALIGVKSFWTWTPTQLYNGLIGGRYGCRKKDRERITTWGGKVSWYFNWLRSW